MALLVIFHLPSMIFMNMKRQWHIVDLIGQ